MYEKEYEEYKRLVKRNNRDLKWIFVIMFIATLLFLSTCYNICKRAVAQYELKMNPHIIIEDVEVGKR